MPPVEAASSFLLLFLNSLTLTHTPIPYCWQFHPILLSQSYSPPKTAFKKPTRNPHTTHVEISLTSDQNPNGRHTCDRHAANLLRFVHGLIGFRDGGFHLDVRSVRSVGMGGILY